MEFLETELAKEREDRIQSLDEQLAPIDEIIRHANDDLDAEKNSRVQ